VYHLGIFQFIQEVNSPESIFYPKSKNKYRNQDSYMLEVPLPTPRGRAPKYLRCFLEVSAHLDWFQALDSPVRDGSPVILEASGY
jgi:hypothetical protein